MCWDLGQVLSSQTYCYQLKGKESDLSAIYLKCSIKAAESCKYQQCLHLHFVVLLCHNVQIQQDPNQEVPINYNDYPLIMGVPMRSQGVREKKERTECRCVKHLRSPLSIQSQLSILPSGSIHLSVFCAFHSLKTRIMA